MPTLTALYQSLGVPPPRNIRTGWSSRSDSRVVLALWSESIVNDGMTYYDDNGGTEEHEARLFADKQRREHLAYALEQLHGEVFSIIVTRKRGTVKETIESQEVGPTWRVTQFNPKTGAFRLEKITFANRRHHADT